MSSPKDIEVYIKDASLHEIKDWLESKFGPILATKQSPDTGMTHFPGYTVPYQNCTPSAD